MNNYPKKFIAFDIGAESGRCVIALFEGKQISLNEIHRFPTHTVKYKHGFHWNILSIYESLIEGLSKAQKIYGKNFQGIGIDTWGVDYVLLDAENRVLGYPYHYRDERTDNIMDYAFGVINNRALYRKTGIQHAQFNTIFQLLAEKKRKMNLLKVTDKMLLIPDYLNFLLCGVKSEEYSIASTTGLTNPYTRDWSWEIIEAFDLPPHIFPPIIEPGNRIGTLLPHIAEAAGLSNDIPVFTSAGHDTASAVMGIPACNEKNWAFLSSGTWSLMGIELKNPLISTKSFEYNFTNEGGVENTTRFLKNILGLWPLQECRRNWCEKGHEYSFEDLNNLAKNNGYAHSWLDLNNIKFFKAGNMPEKIEQFLTDTQQNSTSDPAFIIQVILESLAFSYKKCIEEIESITGNIIENLHIVGGGIQNEYLMQLTADAINKKVIAGPVEGAVVGNIGVQAIASGLIYDRFEWRNIVLNSFKTKVYEPKNPHYFSDNENKFNDIVKRHR